MSAAGGGRTPRDLIDAYLAELRASLRATPAEAKLVAAEAEDHLLQNTAAGLAAGLTGREAQEAAIAAFGSVRAVVRAHESTPGNLLRGRTPAAILGELFLGAWKLGGIGLIAVGASGLVVALMNVMFGRAFTGQAPAGVTFPKARCAYWKALWPGAHSFPLLATCVFGAGALALVLAQLTGFTVTEGPGAKLSGAFVAALVAAGYGVRARPAFRHLMRGWARYVRAR